MLEQYDSEQIYCRRLGHTLQFAYCRIENNVLPCPRIMDCWFERIDIGKFIESNYTEEERKTIFSGPKDKLSTIFDIISRNAAENEESRH